MIPWITLVVMAVGTQARVKVFSLACLRIRTLVRKSIKVGVSYPWASIQPSLPRFQPTTEIISEIRQKLRCFGSWAKLRDWLLDITARGRTLPLLDLFEGAWQMKRSMVWLVWFSYKWSNKMEDGKQTWFFWGCKFFKFFVVSYVELAKVWVDGWILVNKNCFWTIVRSGKRSRLGRLGPCPNQ